MEVEEGQEVSEASHRLHDIDRGVSGGRLRGDRDLDADEIVTERGLTWGVTMQPGLEI